MNFLLRISFKPDTISSSSHFCVTQQEVDYLINEYKKVCDCQVMVFKLRRIT